MNQLWFRPVQHLKMTFLSSLLWKISMLMAKKWLERVRKRPLVSPKFCEKVFMSWTVSALFFPKHGQNQQIKLWNLPIVSTYEDAIKISFPGWISIRINGIRQKLLLVLLLYQIFNTWEWSLDWEAAAGFLGFFLTVSVIETISLKSISSL